VEADVRLQPTDQRLVQRPSQALDRGRAVVGLDHQLRQQRVVLRGQRALHHRVVDAHARPFGGLPGSDAAGDRLEAVPRILGVDPGLDGVAAGLGDQDGRVKRLARGDADLPGHQVEACDQLGDTVLHLEAGVHLQEVVVAIVVH
jgi:hypothetical protein